MDSDDDDYNNAGEPVWEDFLRTKPAAGSVFRYPSIKGW